MRSAPRRGVAHLLAFALLSSGLATAAVLGPTPEPTGAVTAYETAELGAVLMRGWWPLGAGTGAAGYTSARYAAGFDAALLAIYLIKRRRERRAFEGATRWAAEHGYEVSGQKAPGWHGPYPTYEVAGRHGQGSGSVTMKGLRADRPTFLAEG